MVGSTTYTVIAVCCMLAFLKVANASLSDALESSGRASLKSSVVTPSEEVPVITCENHPIDEDVSACCTQVKRCPDFISPNRTKYGIHNTMNVKLNSCSCDAEFLNCLQRASKTSQSNLYEEIAKSYFGWRKRKCLLSLYNSSCNGSFYDRAGRKYDNNYSGRYFCAVLHRIKYDEPLRAP